MSIYAFFWAYSAIPTNTMKAANGISTPLAASNHYL